MDLFLQIIMFIYIVVAFFLTNILAKRIVQKYTNTKWFKRRYILPLGCVLTVAILFLLAAFASTEVIIFVMVPIISLFVGIIAYTSFFKVSEYEKAATKSSPYMKKKK